MSDPAEQGEQVDEVFAFYGTPRDLAVEVCRLRERVRLLEQREKGLQEALEVIVNLDQDEPGFAASPDYYAGLETAAREARAALATTQASGEESDD